MASVQKTAKGWRAQVYVKGQRDSGMFRTRREADTWAAKREVELRNDASQTPAERHTLRDLFVLYRDEVSTHKRGWHKETVRINRFLTDPMLPLDAPLSKVGPDHLQAWRRDRATQVSPGSVIRELGLLSSVFRHAWRELRWIASNPVREVTRPPKPKSRTRVITRVEIKAMLVALDHRPSVPPSSTRHAIAACFLVALSTGMRAQELCGLTWDRVFEDHVHLPQTKTIPRDVPLTLAAKRRIERMRGYHDSLVFGLKTGSLDALFRKYREAAGLDGFTFHDSRHTAATWLAPRLDVLDLCRMFGWSDPKMAMVYYNPTGSDIAARLRASTGKK